MQSQHRPTQSGTQFGVAVDSPPLYFLTVIDIDNQRFKIPYSHESCNVQEILRTYWNITSLHSKFKKRAWLRILQGIFKDELALSNMKISCLGLDINQPCFQVLDSATVNLEESIQTTLSILNKQYEGSIILIKINFNGKKIDYQMSIDDKIQKFKAKMIIDLPDFKQFTPDMIKLQHRGYFLSDQNIISEYSQIRKQPQIRVIIKKIQGCFRAQTKFTMADFNQLYIEKVKSGDYILSFNQKNGVYQRDEVKHVQETCLYQAIKIVLENGIQVYTTPNHLFLCSDNIYRKVSAQYNAQKQQLLKPGTQLRFNQKTQKISTMQMISLNPPQKFYHLSITKNHNFIVNGLVAHNMFINIKFPNNIKQKLNVSPMASISSIKQQLQSSFSVAYYHQRLVFAGRELKDQQSLSDNNIQKDAMLSFVIKKSQNFNFVASNTLVDTSEGQKLISEVSQKEQLMTFNSQGNLRKEPVAQIITLSVRQYFDIEFKNSQKILSVSGDCYLELNSGQAVCIRYLFSIFKNEKSIVLRSNTEQNLEIKSIKYHFCQQPLKFYKIIFANSDSYVAQKVVIPTTIANFLILKNDQVFKRISINASPDTSFGVLKQKIALITKISIHALQFTFNNEKLEDQGTLMQQQIRTQNIIIVNANLAQSTTSFIISGSDDQQQQIQIKKLYLQMSPSEKNIIEYKKYAEMTVQQIMKELMPNYKSSYFFLFAELIILPHQPLKRIRESNNFYLAQNTIILVKNEKLSFIMNMNIQGKEVMNHSHIINHKPISKIQIEASEITLDFAQYEAKINEAAKRIKEKVKSVQLTQPNFYLPFLYFSTHKYEQNIKDFIVDFQYQLQEEQKKNSIFLLIKSLYINLNYLKNYLGECFVGIRNFKFSQFFKKNQNFYWHNFTQARLNSQSIIKDLKGQRGTLFHIKSNTAKKISQFSLHPQYDQVLFAPYTYFVVQRIAEKEEMDQVWLTEMTSPVTFQKNIILWVDDIPSNNTQLINKILSVKDIEILQVTSTVIAERWVKQFGWLLTWKGLQFKLISDMGRIQGVGDQQKFNPSAGIDLLESLYKSHGITAQTLIFCGDAKKAKEKAQQRQIPSTLFYQICDTNQELQIFCQIKMQYP